MAGCSVRIHAGGHTTVVDVGLPVTVARMEIRLAQTIGNVVLDGAGSSALSGQVGYWRTAPTVTTDQNGISFSVRIPGEKNVTNSGNSRIPDMVLHVGARVSAAGFTRNGDYWLSPGFRNDQVLEVSVKIAMGELHVTR